VAVAAVAAGVIAVFLMRAAVEQLVVVRLAVMLETALERNIIRLHQTQAVLVAAET
jgi:hypothetical protein